MKDLAPIVGHNLASLRKARGLTQGELAEKFHYTDKSISKWEHGEAIPDLSTLDELAEFYGVTIDYLIHDQTEPSLVEKGQCNPLQEKINKVATALLGIVFVWTAAVVVYIGFRIVPSWQNKPWNPWMAFVWACPASLVVASGFNRKWGKHAWDLPLDLCLSWALLGAIYLEIAFDYPGEGWKYWFILILAVPLTIFLILFSRTKKN
jgi:transcriptional regulator with XRE-family HTH domain